jgi:hypothetical protein
MNPEAAEPAWISNIDEEDWIIYDRFLEQAFASGVRFALGGAFALAVYANHLRNTKDLDIYVAPSDKDSLIQATGRCGFEDFFSRLPYDRNWIYRSCFHSSIVDIIWAMPNRRSVVDAHWLTAGPLISIRGWSLRVLPIEELIWSKMYVLQRERCDWPDVMNMLYHSGPIIDWDHLLERVSDDLPLLQSALALFAWLCPDRTRQIPDRVWQSVRVKDSECGSKAHLLDTRPWFGDEFHNWPN